MCDLKTFSPDLEGIQKRSMALSQISTRRLPARRVSDVAYGVTIALSTARSLAQDPRFRLWTS